MGCVSVCWEGAGSRVVGVLSVKVNKLARFENLFGLRVRGESKTHLLFKSLDQFNNCILIT